MRNREWLASVERFVTDHLPRRPARILEVGCGDGELALALAEAGNEVTAIDPRAPERDIFMRSTLEEFEGAGPFDAVVGIVVLHHLHDMDAGLEKIGTLLAPSGRLVLAEFAWERIDAGVLGWCAARLPEGAHNWITHLIEAWQFGGGHADAARDGVARWARDEGIHGYQEMRRALARHLVQEHLEWAPYLFDDLAASEWDEARAIVAGDIQPVGFRYVGAPRD